MALRFVNEKMYDHDWYRKIGSHYRDVWMFLWLRIHPVGVWHIEPDLVEMYTGVKPFKLQDFIKACNSAELLPEENKNNERLVVLPDRRHLWFVYYTITQHSGGLSQHNPAHKPVFKALREYNLLERVSQQYKDRNLIVGNELDAITLDLQRVEDEAFEVFWKAYPHKVNKVMARKAFHEHVGQKHPELLPLILNDIAHRLSVREWDPTTKDGMHFIIHPDRYLKRHRWEDAKAPAGQGNALTDKDHDQAFRRSATA